MDSNNFNKKFGGLSIFQAHLRGEGGVNRDIGGLFERDSLFNFEKTIVSVLYKELEYKLEKLKKKKLGGDHAVEDQNQFELPVGK